MQKPLNSYPGKWNLRKLFFVHFLIVCTKSHYYLLVNYNFVQHSKTTMRDIAVELFGLLGITSSFLQITDSSTYEHFWIFLCQNWVTVTGSQTCNFHIEQRNAIAAKPPQWVTLRQEIYLKHSPQCYHSPSDNTRGIFPQWPHRGIF